MSGSSSTDSIDESLMEELRHSRTTRKLSLNMRSWATLPPQVVSEMTFHGEFLERLSIQGSRLTAIPPNIPILVPHLRTLDLSSNLLASLGSALGTLRNLRCLTLYDNKLTSLPSPLQHLTNLESIDASSNALEFIAADAFCGLTALTSLNLADNALSSLPRSVSTLVSLQILSVHTNEITGLPTELGSLRALQRLSLHHNALTAVPSSLGALAGSLTTLELHANDLEILPKSLGALTALRTLTTGGNDSLFFPPLAVCKKGPAAVLAYLREEPLEDNNNVPQHLQLQGRPMPSAVPSSSQLIGAGRAKAPQETDAGERSARLDCIFMRMENLKLRCSFVNRSHHSCIVMLSFCITRVSNILIYHTYNNTHNHIRPPGCSCGRHDALVDVPQLPDRTRPSRGSRGDSAHRRAGPGRERTRSRAAARRNHRERTRGSRSRSSSPGARGRQKGSGGRYT